MPLRLVSFNILSDDYVDGQDPRFMKRYYNGLPSHVMQWSSRAGAVMKTLASLNADVFMLQEVMTAARSQLVAAFPDYYVGPLAYHHFQVDHINHNRTGNVVMVRRAVCRVRPTFWAEPLGYGYHMAVATFQWRQPLALERPCVDAAVLSLHLSDSPQKHAQVRRLMSTLEPFHECDLVVGGDFNTTSKKVHRLLNRRFFSSSIHTDQADHHYGTYLCARPMIDYIYTSFRVRQVHIDNDPVNSDRHTCFVRTLGEIGSDHYPVTAEV